MNRFQRDTAVEALGGGRFGVQIDRGWWVMRGPNGGYTAAIVLRALRAAVGDPARLPRSFTIHFTSPPVEGPAEVQTTLERVGRTVTTATARLEQGGKLRALALAAFGTPRTGPNFAHLARPEATPPERTRPLSAGFTIPLRERYESLEVFGPPAAGTPDAVTGGWIRLREGAGAPEAELLAAYTDSWPPALLSQVPREQLASGVPTVDLTVHFRAPWPEHEDPSDFALVVFRSRVAHDGFVEEDGEVWTRGGVLLAQSRQLALIA